MSNYIAQVVLFQVLFLVVYDLFLSKETFFVKNRWYLLITSSLAFIVPFIKILEVKNAVAQEFVVYLPELVLSTDTLLNKVSTRDSIDYVEIVFCLGVLVFLVVFLIKLVKIIQVINRNTTIKDTNFTLVLLPNETKAFSFFNYIFLGDAIPENQKQQIIKHELVHSQQKHSLDMLYFEGLKILMWFNPIIYLYQKRIALAHEYISDEVASKLESKEVYINHLLSNFFEVQNIVFINQFYKQSFIKKRIIMMTKTKSKKRNQLKYLVLIPVLLSMLMYVSCSTSNNKSQLLALQTENQVLNDSLQLVKRQVEIHSSLVKFLKNKIPNDTKPLNIEDGVSFMVIDKAPTFPGCEVGDKDCFTKMVQNHFTKNFDAKMTNELGLESGKKRVFIGFKIDKLGNIIQVVARAPHKKIEEEVIKLINSLPKMTPGEHNGDKVDVKFSLPILLVID